MFYYLIAPFLQYNLILIAAAVIPAIYLIAKVYHLDHLEKESPLIIRRLVIGGILSALMALIGEKILFLVLDYFVDPYSELYNIILYFGVVATVEEGCKYIMLKRYSWNSAEFNCQYDGVVYAVAVSLGFALWENISYVLHFGLVNAFVRAFTAIPGHASFGVFMGVFYSLAKKSVYDNLSGSESVFKVMALVVPILLHGSYDYIASMQGGSLSMTFVVFVVILFFVTNMVINKVSRNDSFF